MRSSLAKVLPSKPDPEQIKREGWREHDILVVSLHDERLDWVRQEQVRQIGELLYGKGANHGS